MTSQLLGPVEVRSLAERLGIRPTKRLGQNFVHDPNTVRRIVRAAGLAPDDVVVEVGPGLGSLTLALLPAVAHVHAVEIDRALAVQLPDTAAERAPELADRLSVVGANALRVTAAQLRPEPTALVANLPYNVAVPVVLYLLAELPGLRCGLVMVQAEVAQRLAACVKECEAGICGPAQTDTSKNDEALDCLADLDCETEQSASVGLQECAAHCL